MGHPFSWGQLRKPDWLHMGETSLARFWGGLWLETGHREQRKTSIKVEPEYLWCVGGTEESTERHREPGDMDISNLFVGKILSN